MDSLQHKEMKELYNGERIYLKRLIDALEVQVYFIDPESLDVQKL
ncbi:hypothetical protein J2T12_004845 [Paenibacillus anaericanus]|nr:hypothetical protein [Paenibacillus anaericanus]